MCGEGKAREGKGGEGRERESKGRGTRGREDEVMILRWRDALLSLGRSCHVRSCLPRCLVKVRGLGWVGCVFCVCF